MSLPQKRFENIGETAGVPLVSLLSRPETRKRAIVEHCEELRQRLLDGLLRGYSALNDVHCPRLLPPPTLSKEELVRVSEVSRAAGTTSHCCALGRMGKRSRACRHSCATTLVDAQWEAESNCWGVRELVQTTASVEGPRGLPLSRQLPPRALRHDLPLLESGVGSARITLTKPSRTEQNSCSSRYVTRRCHRKTLLSATGRRCARSQALAGRPAVAASLPLRQ
jgi:hypothetical protein